MPSRVHGLLAAATGILVLAGCDDKGITSTDTDVEDDVRELLDVGEDGCWYEQQTAEPTEQVTLYGEYEDGEGEAWEFWIWEGVIEGETLWPPVTLVQVEVWPEHGGPGEPGTYEISEGSYAECGLCMLVREGCTPDDGVALCERDYLAISGTVEIDEMGAPGEMISGTVTEAYLVEARIDWDSGDFESTPVEGGATWCIGEMELETGVSMYPER